MKDQETDRLARQVASLAGETLSEALRTSLAERLARERLKRGQALPILRRYGVEATVRPAFALYNTFEEGRSPRRGVREIAAN